MVGAVYKQRHVRLSRSRHSKSAISQGFNIDSLRTLAKLYVEHSFITENEADAFLSDIPVIGERDMEPQVKFNDQLFSTVEQMTTVVLRLRVSQSSLNTQESKVEFTSSSQAPILMLLQLHSEGRTSLYQLGPLWQRWLAYGLWVMLIHSKALRWVCESFVVVVDGKEWTIGYQGTQVWFWVSSASVDTENVCLTNWPLNWEHESSSVATSTLMVAGWMAPLPLVVMHENCIVIHVCNMNKPSDCYLVAT